MSEPEPTSPVRFPPLMRVLHWLLAALLLSMLFIGVSMVTSLSNYHRLLAIHRPLGIAILVLAVIRLVNRRLSRLPPFPVTMSERERRVASLSELLLYGLMIGLPLVGWAMLSAGNYPIVMCGAFHLPAICRQILRCTARCATRTPCSPTYCFSRFSPI